MREGDRMSRYIDVDDITYNYIIPSTTTNTPCVLAVTKDKIDAMPTIYVAPVVHGYWIDKGNFEQCSVCKETHLKGFTSSYGKVTWIKTAYCSNCGAKMHEPIQSKMRATVNAQDMYDLGFADKMG